MVSQLIRKKGTKRSQPRLDMPPYLTLSNNTCYFRQSFPPALRPLLGKRDRASLLDTDRHQRIDGMSAEEFAEYGAHIDQISAPKGRLIGQVSPHPECPGFSIESERPLTE